MQKRWDLTELVPKLDSKEYALFLERLEKEVRSLETVRPKLDSFSGKDLLEVLKTKERIDELSSCLGAYAYMRFSEDTGNSEARAFRSKIEDLFASLSNRTLFFNLWFKGLEEDKAQELIKAASEHTYLLTRIRETKPYSLKESEEQIVNLKDISGASALVKVYNMLTSSFMFTLELDGKKKIMTQEEIRAYARNPDSKIRAAMYKELLRVFGNNGQVLGELYCSLVTDWKNENIILRKYKSPVAARNISNDIPEASYNTLLKTIRKNTPFFQKYFDLKFKACNVKDKSRYHIYAPYESKEKKYSYEEAVKIVLNNFKKFSPKMADLAENLVKQNHIDIEIRKGKVSGAYCHSITPKIVPYVLINYDGTIRNVFTLAHELGHAVHYQLAAKNSILNFHPSIPLAETASIFSEMMLFDKLMETEKNSEVKKGMLIQKLDDVYASIGRQGYFTIFEETAHKMIADGAGVDTLKKEYYKQLCEQFGSIKVPQEFEWEWTYVPHFYEHPFYCYGYSFGNLLVLALYERYKEEGESFIPHYLKVLAYGGSQRPQKVLEEIGIDICSEKFWQSGFEIIENMIKDLKKLK